MNKEARRLSTEINGYNFTISQTCAVAERSAFRAWAKASVGTDIHPARADLALSILFCEFAITLLVRKTLLIFYAPPATNLLRGNVLRDLGIAVEWAGVEAQFSWAPKEPLASIRKRLVTDNGNFHAVYDALVLMIDKAFPESTLKPQDQKP